MKKNLYYRTMFRRQNAIKEFFLTFFYAICSIPRLLLEVFIRKNLGERYFSFSTAMVIAFVLLGIPFTIGAIPSLYNRYSGAEFDIITFLSKYLTWYLFLAGFVAKCLDRRHELKRLPSVFDFARFSLSAGTIHPSFYQFQFKGRSFNIREIETMLEPGFFFIIGLALMLIGQPIGYLIIICAICYSMSYFATYHNGDNFIMDKIDEMILNEESVNAFVDGMDPEDTRGVRYYGRTPADPEMRRQLVDSIVVDSDFVEAK